MISVKPQMNDHFSIDHSQHNLHLNHYNNLNYFVSSLFSVGCEVHYNIVDLTYFDLFFISHSNEWESVCVYTHTHTHTHTQATSLGTPVQSNAIKCYSSAINSTFLKFIHFQFLLTLPER